MKRKVPFFVAFLVGLLVITNVMADAVIDHRRIQIGFRQFKAVLAADMDLANKLDKQGRLILGLVYRGNPDLASAFATQLMQMGQGESEGRILDIPYLAKPVTAKELTNLIQPPAGIYLLDHPGAPTLRYIVDYAIESNRILYSPFEGHVEQGVMSGMTGTVKPRPYINLATLKSSSVRLNNFFLKVADQYAP